MSKKPINNANETIMDDNIFFSSISYLMKSLTYTSNALTWIEDAINHNGFIEFIHKVNDVNFLNKFLNKIVLSGINFTKTEDDINNLREDINCLNINLSKLNKDSINERIDQLNRYFFKYYNASILVKDKQIICTGYDIFNVSQLNFEKFWDSLLLDENYNELFWFLELIFYIFSKKNVVYQYLYDNLCKKYIELTSVKSIVNCINNCSHIGASLKDVTIYTTNMPTCDEINYCVRIGINNIYRVKFSTTKSNNDIEEKLAKISSLNINEVLFDADHFINRIFYSQNDYKIYINQLCFYRNDNKNYNSLFILIATFVSLRSHDNGSQVGCCLMKKIVLSINVPDGNRETYVLFSTGYNSYNDNLFNNETIFDNESSLCVEDTINDYIVHAEEGAILNSLKNGINMENTFAFSTLICCDKCQKMLWNCGIKNILYRESRYKIKSKNISINNMEAIDTDEILNNIICAFKREHYYDKIIEIINRIIDREEKMKNFKKEKMKNFSNIYKDFCGEYNSNKTLRDVKNLILIADDKSEIIFSKYVILIFNFNKYSYKKSSDITTLIEENLSELKNDLDKKENCFTDIIEFYLSKG